MFIILLTAVPAVFSDENDTFREELLQELNALRRQYGCGPLAFDEHLESAAQHQAEFLAEIKKLQDEQRIYEGGNFTWPCPGYHYITYTFGYRFNPYTGLWSMHNGIDISAPNGVDIVAAASGKVILSQWYQGYGNCVIVDHGSGIVTLYGHASVLCVSQGQEVSRGQVIAKVGTTGNSTGYHLHFEVRLKGQPVDPLQYF